MYCVCACTSAAQHRLFGPAETNPSSPIGRRGINCLLASGPQHLPRDSSLRLAVRVALQLAASLEGNRLIGGGLVDTRSLV